VYFKIASVRKGKETYCIIFLREYEGIMIFLYYFIVFLIAFLIESYHDYYRMDVEKGGEYDFKRDRKSKLIKGFGWTLAVLILSHWDLKVLLLYWVEKSIFFHPMLRLFTHGVKFVFSKKGILWMIEHSEIFYWWQILRKGRRE